MNVKKAATSIIILSLLMVILSGPVMARDYVNMRSSPPPPGEVCASDSRGSTPSYPLSGITVQASEELRGVRRDLALSKVLQMPDVQNVLKESPQGLKLSFSEAKVVLNTLKQDNTLLVVVIPGEEAALIYYEMAQPLFEKDPEGKGYKSIYRSQAMLVRMEDEVVKLASTSINGRLVSLAPRPLGTSCGGCVSIFGPWEVDSRVCTSWDNGCLVGCGLQCGSCIASCGACVATGAWWACVGCISCALGCGYCTSRCCQNWVDTCTSCGTLP